MELSPPAWREFYAFFRIEMDQARSQRALGPLLEAVLDCSDLDQDIQLYLQGQPVTSERSNCVVVTSPMLLKGLQL